MPNTSCRARGLRKAQSFTKNFFFSKPLLKAQSFYTSKGRNSNERGVNLVQYLEGILKIANLILAVVAGIVGISLIKISRSKKELNAWVMLIIALMFFAVQEILGALRAFNLFESAYLTHIVPTFILVFLIIALIKQMHIQKTK